MNRAVCTLLCWLMLACGAGAQSASDPNEGSHLVPGTAGTDYLYWWGRSGRTYFVQWSVDLTTWHYFPDVIESGHNSPLYYYFLVSGTDRLFLRLKYTDLPTSNPVGGDFDGDKVPNGVEIEIGTDPFHFADSDLDGMPDDWETWFGLDPHNPGDATGNFDGDMLNNLAEYQNGVAGTDPTDYYNGVYPVVQIISGNYQTAEPGQFSLQSLVFEAKFGTTPVSHGPLTIRTDGLDAGQVSLTNDGTGLTTSLPLSTGTDGRVQVYYKHPAASPYVPTTRQIHGQVGSTAQDGSTSGNYATAISQADYNYPAGTMGRNATEAIDTRLAGKTPASSLLVFTTQDHSTPTYIRNTSSWCYDLRQQMTCISPWNSDGIYAKAGTAITAQHIIAAKHFDIAVGSTIRFITANNTVVLKTIVGRADVPNTDISVYTLNSPLPASITPCKILPANYGSYLSYLEQGRPPVMMLDQQEKALVSELHAINDLANFIRPALHLHRLEFYEDAIGGDSGNPAFLIINDTLVLLATLHDYATGSGSFATPSVLNSLIPAADADATINNPGFPATGLQVQTVDLSGFSPFTPP